MFYVLIRRGNKLKRPKLSRCVIIRLQPPQLSLHFHYLPLSKSLVSLYSLPTEANGRGRWSQRQQKSLILLFWLTCFMSKVPPFFKVSIERVKVLSSETESKKRSHPKVCSHSVRAPYNFPAPPCSLNANWNTNGMSNDAPPLTIGKQNTNGMSNDAPPLTIEKQNTNGMSNDALPLTIGKQRRNRHLCALARRRNIPYASSNGAEHP
jgi:hypothetical protein